MHRENPTRLELQVNTIGRDRGGGGTTAVVFRRGVMCEGCGPGNQASTLEYVPTLHSAGAPIVSTLNVECGESLSRAGQRIMANWT